MERKQFMHPRMAATAAAALIEDAGAARAAETGQETDPEFRRLGVNRDGYLRRGEARKNRGFDRAFSEADDHCEGKLDAAGVKGVVTVRNGLVIKS